MGECVPEKKREKEMDTKMEVRIKVSMLSRHSTALC